MAGRLIGDAYISILPDTDRFLAQAEAQLKGPLSTWHPTASLNLDTKTAEAKVAAFGKMNPELKATLDTSKVLAKMKTLSQMKPSVTVGTDLDTAALLKKLAGLSTYLKSHPVEGIDVPVGVNLAGTIANVEKALMDVRALVKRQGDTIPLEMRANLAELLRQVAGDVSAAQMWVKDHPGELDINTNNARTLAHVQELLSEAKVLVSRDDLKLDIGVEMPKVLPALAATDAALKTLNADAEVATIRAAQATNAWGIGGWGGAMGFLGTKIALFGGALDGILPKMLTSVSVFHILGEGILEIAAVWGPAIIGMAAFAAVASETARNVYTQFTNMNTVLTATGKNLAYFRGGMDQLKYAIQPQVLQLLGDFFTTATPAAGHFEGVLRSIGNVLDTMGAKVALYFQNYKGSAFLHNASKDLAGLGDAFLQVGRIIHVFIVALPGYAEIILKLGDAFLTLTANALQGLEPVISLFLKLHGALFYIGLATTAILTFGRAFAAASIATFAARSGVALEGLGANALSWAKKFTSSNAEVAAAAGNSGSKLSNWSAGIGNAIGNIVGWTVKGGKALVNWTQDFVKLAQETSFAGAATSKFGSLLSAIPFGPLGLIIGALALAVGFGLYKAFHQASDAAVKFNASVQQVVASSNLMNLQHNIAAGIEATTHQISLATAGVGKYSQSSQGFLKTTLGAVINFGDGLNPLIGQTQRYNKNLSDLSAGLRNLVTENDNAGVRLNSLSRQFGSTANVMSLMNLAGVKQSAIATDNAKQWALDQQKIMATAAAYGFMGQQAGALGNQLDALNIQQGEVYKATQNLTQAETAWVTLITSGSSAFNSFEQGQSTLAQALNSATAGAVKFNAQTGKLTATGTAVGASMNGLSQASLAARGSFDQQVTAGGTLFTNLQTLAAASGNTAKAQSQLSAAGKDIIAQLLPMAKGSKEATAEVYGLAQIVGYTGKDSFAAMSKWVGNTTNAVADLNSKQTALTVSSANLSQASKNLGSALKTQVTATQAAAIASSAGLGQATQNLAKDVQDAHGKITALSTHAASQYVSSLEKMGVSTSDAKSFLNAYLKQLGMSPSQIAAMDRSLGHATSTQHTANATMAAGSAATVQFAGILQKLGGAANYVTGSFSQMSSQVTHIFDMLRHTTASVWDGMRHDIATDTDAANAQVASVFDNMRHTTANIFNGLRHDTASIFDGVRHDLASITAAAASETAATFDNLRHNTANIFDGLRHDTASTFDSLRHDTASTFIRMASETAGTFDNLRHGTANTFNGLRHDTAGEFDGVKHDVLSIADQITSSLINAWNWMRRETAAIFSGIVSDVGRIWSKMGNLVASPVRFVVNDIYDPFAQVIDTVTNFLGMGKPLPTKHFAAGGVVSGGIHGVDSVHAMLAPGELVIPASHAPAHMDQAKREGIPGFAGGGIPNPITAVGHAASSLGHGIASAAGDVGHFLVSGLGDVSKVLGHLVKGSVEGAVKPLLEKIFGKHVGGSGQFGADMNKLGPKLLQGALNWLSGQDNKANAAKGGSGGSYGGPASFAGGFESLGALVSFARYFMSQGLNAAAAAGVAATISGEETSAGPESVGSGGFGLIGWTGNTIGLPSGYHGPTGNVGYDLSAQLAGVIGYMNSRGGAGPLNAAGNPVTAGDIWSGYEAPLVPLSDTRPGNAVAIYNALMAGGGSNVKKHSAGGMISEPVLGFGTSSGMPYSFAENGPEQVIPGGAATQGAGGTMQPMTSYQGNDVLSALSMMIKLLQQMPFAFASSVNSTSKGGVQHGYFGTPG